MEYTYLDSIALFGVGGAHPGGLQLTKHMLAQEKINNTTTVLDVGCGTGQTSAYLAKKYRCKVTALDCHKVMLEKAKQRFKSMNLPINVIYGKTESLPFDNDSFDIILSESVTAFTDLSLTLPEYKRVLKPKGKLLAVEMTLERSVLKEEYTQIKDFYGVSQLLTERDWHKLFQKAGYDQVRIEKYNPQLNQFDVQHTADFSLSDNIDYKAFEILEKHDGMMNKYAGLLSYRIIKCTK